ncbi:MAG: response regulator transcription factor [Oribacterium sp.]|nr:response regulator transcription factor [Oribacterium sp.]MBO6308901.1 response regulator transcription factor [Oribacterium sp.]MBP3803693.1 response regulator transcription factor [Oribacterium sp.]
MINVLIVEDQRMPRESMEHMITESGRYELAGSISSAELAITKCRRQHVDLILMDVCTSGNKDGIDAAAEIHREFPDTKIIVITSMAEVSFLDRARKAGADSFWYKDSSPETLMEVIDKTMSGEHLYPEKTPTVQIGMITSDDLTPAEIEVLRLVCEGMEYGEIAEKLLVSRNTVKSHISHILQKTGYPNKIRLAIAVTNKKFIIPNKRD